MPIALRLIVARRQVTWRQGLIPLYLGSAKSKLQFYLHSLFGNEPYHLDHDPSLILRPYNPRIKNVAARYTPNANDPAYLVYRSVAEHRKKTFVTGEHGQLSDTILRAKNKRMDENRGRRKQRPKVKIANRPFPKRKP